MNDAPVFTIDDLTLATPAGKVLIAHGQLTLGHSELALLVGPSGSGKSSLIKLLSGLLAPEDEPWQIQGRLHHGGRDYDLSREQCDVGALVFQNYALFDDLGAAENLSIAQDHAASADPDLTTLILDLLADIDPEQSVAASSGGQRQRIAIARTLLANRPLLLFDEPNSGLDPHSAQRLGKLIRTLCRRMGRPALIVAHHVDDLLPLVDSVYLLDTAERRLRPLPVDREAVDRALLEVGKAHGESERTPAAPAHQEDWRDRLVPRDTGHWFLRYLKEYFWILWASPMMLTYTFAGAALVGFVNLWFGFNYELLGDAVRSFVHDESLAGIGYLQANIAIPLITCIMLVARNNAVITADLGSRMLSSQFLAMRNLHIPGRRYLSAAIMSNTAIGSLVLVGASLAVSAWASLQTWQLLFPGQPVEMWQENFFFHLLNRPETWAADMGWASLKVLLSCTCGAWLAIREGLMPKDSVIAVNYAIARSIVKGVTAALLIHAGIAVLTY